MGAETGTKTCDTENLLLPAELLIIALKLLDINTPTCTNTPTTAVNRWNCGVIRMEVLH